jgi:flavin-dependent dehydrogenase
MAETVGMNIQLDVYEPRDFSLPAPHGCNMCGGVVSESLVQTLAAEGINLPTDVVQRGIESYVLHTDVGNVRIEPRLQEARIAAVHRGLGPRTTEDTTRRSFDGYLQQLAVERGASLIHEKVTEVSWSNGKPQLKTKNGLSAAYDLLVVAVGVNTAALKLFQQPELDYKPPVTAKTVIFEYFLGEETVGKVLGDSMHVFLLNLPRLEFAAIIPKGDFVSVCMLGEDIDSELVESFVNSPEVRECLPAEVLSQRSCCGCKPRINIQGALRPYADRILFVGDCGVTRLYKDGIGAAYRTGKAAAAAAVFQGISAESVKRHYWPVCQSIGRDNSYGKFTFSFTRVIQKWRFARRALLSTIASEQRNRHRTQHLSGAMWNIFTGSAPYKEILVHMVHPVHLMRLFWNVVISVLPLRVRGQ